MAMARSTASSFTKNWSEKLSTVHQFDVLGTDLRVNAAHMPEPQMSPATSQPPGSPGTRPASSTTPFTTLGAGKGRGRYKWYKADGMWYNTLTGGINIKPTANLMVRPEIRYMSAPGNDLIYSGSGYTGELFSETVLGIVAILTF